MDGQSRNLPQAHGSTCKPVAGSTPSRSTRRSADSSTLLTLLRLKHRDGLSWTVSLSWISWISRHGDSGYDRAPDCIRARWQTQCHGCPRSTASIAISLTALVASLPALHCTDRNCTARQEAVRTLRSTTARKSLGRSNCRSVPQSVLSALSLQVGKWSPCVATMNHLNFSHRTHHSHSHTAGGCLCCAGQWQNECSSII